MENNRMSDEAFSELQARMSETNEAQYWAHDWLNDNGEPMTIEEYREMCAVCEDGIWDDQLPRITEEEPDITQSYWGKSRQLDGVVYFASGTNHAGEIRGVAKGGYHLGVAIPELNNDAIDALTDLGGTTKVFADSGAFSEVAFDQNGPHIQHAITHSEWLKRLDLYATLAKHLGERLFVVAPDCVAHQKETLERLSRYASEVRTIAHQSNVIVPVQKGELPMAQFWAAEQQTLGCSNLIAGIPMKKDATTLAELEQFVVEAQPARIHLLGLGIESKGFAQAVKIIRTHAPSCSITCDSVLLRRLVGRTNGRGNGPRVLTARRDELLQLGWNAERVTELKETMTATTLLDRDCGHVALLTSTILTA